VHSPYSAQERDRAHVQHVAEDYGIHHAVYIDHDVAFFAALGASNHPTFFLIDKHGRVRMGEYGAQIAGSPSAKRFEATIQTLLREP
jgi:hypothetical protein